MQSPRYASLTHRQTVELLKTLGGGSIGFDAKNGYTLSDLRSFIQHWIATGAYTPDYVESCVDAVLALHAMPAAPSIPAAPQPRSVPTAPPAPQPSAPTAPQPPAAWTPAYAHGTSLLPAAPQPIQTAAPAPLVAAPLPTPTPQPIAAPAPILPDYAPAPPNAVVGATPTGGTYSRRYVLARSLFPDCPAVQDALPPSLTVAVYDDPAAPAVDPSYVYTPMHVAIALSAFACAVPLPIWCGGPRGSGKTEFLRQIAARLRRSYYRVNFNRATEPSDVVGDVGLADGRTLWQDGPVAQALRTPGAVLALDEISYANAGHLAVLNPLLDAMGFDVRLPRTGGILRSAADVCVAALDNTFGFGDASGEHVARSVLGVDTLDRFRLKLKFDYLDAETETQVLVDRTRDACGKTLTKGTAQIIAKIMQVARTQSSQGELIGAPSLRGAVAFAVALAQGLPVIAAYESAIVYSAPPEAHDALRAIFSGHWPMTGDAGTPAQPTFKGN